MTQDEIIEMADKADEEADKVLNMKGEYHPNWHQVRDEIFAKLVADKEREACAKIAEKEYQDAKTIEETHYKYSDAPFNPRQFGLNMDLVNQSKHLSFAIRARGQA